MDFETVKSLVASMGTMKFFPSEPDVRLALVETMGELAESEDQVRWLVRKMRAGYAEWPGEMEMRICFTLQFRPKNGIAYSRCTCGCGAIEPFNLAPGQEWPSQLTAPEPRALLSVGAVVSADPDLERSVLALAAAKDLNQMGRKPRYIPGIPEVPGIPPEKRITQADVDRAVQELHERKARQELGLDVETAK